ncbi:MAG: TlpA family protein disulfide reductase [Bacteroidales bacterium]|nr:TlpA family protein disulfide reductase [Bacteroidales bacterium]
MRTTYKILLIALIVTSCTKIKNENISTISGYLPDFASKAIHFNSNDSIFTSIVDNTGKFKIKISSNNPHYVHVKELDRNLFLIPNDSLLIKKVDNKYLFLGGQSALINNYYTNWSSYMDAIVDTTDLEKYYNQKPSDFLKSVDKWITIGGKPLSKLMASHPDLNKDFVDCEKARIKYRMYGDLNDYKFKDETIPDDFYSYFETVNLNDSRLILLDEYKYFLNSYVYLKVQRLKLNDKILETSKMLDIIQEYFNNKAIQNIIIKEVIRIQTLNLAVDSTLLERFKLMYSDSLYIQKIENTYLDLKPLSKGNKAPDFEFSDTNGQKISLNDFKGKYLLIDVWSTTCSPCINEMPYLDKIKEENKDKNIEFVAVCLSEETAWKKMLRKLNLKDRQFRVVNGWNSKFRNDYLKSSGVPAYILIDPNGLIIDARAPKPSENLTDIINRLKI